MKPILDILSKREEQPQYVFVGASLPLRLAKTLEIAVPSVTRITLHTLHQKPASLEENFQTVGVHDKQNALLDILTHEIMSDTNQENRQQGQWIVFCNTIQSCRSTEYMLVENGFAGM